MVLRNCTNFLREIFISDTNMIFARDDARNDFKNYFFHGPPTPWQFQAIMFIVCQVTSPFRRPLTSPLISRSSYRSVRFGCARYRQLGGGSRLAGIVFHVWYWWGLIFCCQSLFSHSSLLRNLHLDQSYLYCVLLYRTSSPSDPWS
jgi:hypothetical protein